VLWSLNLSAVFPIVKVLMEGQTLSGYVNKGIVEAKLDIEEREARITYITSELDKLDEHEQQRRAELLTELNKQQQKLSASSRSALLNNWLKTYVLPWLPGDQFDMLAVILGFVMFATVLKSVFIVVQEVLVGNVVELTIMQIRKDCFRHVLKLDYQTLSHAGSSDLMARFTYDLTLMAGGLTLLGGKVVREPLKAVGCIAFAFFVNWRLTLLSMLFVPMVAVVFYRIGRKLKVASRKMMESMSRLYKTLEETFDSLKVVIAFHGGRRHRARFHRENKEYFAKAMKLVHFDAITSPSTEIMGLLAVFIALLPGAYLVLRETKSIWGINLAGAPMDMAQLSLLYVLLAGTLDPVRKLSTIYTKVKRATAAADRVFALMDQKSLVKEPEQPQPAVRHRREIHFDDVTFTYHRGDDPTPRPPVLKDVNLRVRAGEVVVVVGENGSGKSTLVNLLPRYYDPEHGAVRIDGLDIRELRLRDLRAQISVVTQETLLFDESILDNIRYGRPGATVEEVYEAARAAHVTPFVEALPDGFETRVGEKGGRFSGGQRQRIALARAMLRDPAILILDEATSAIDAQSEKLIHAAIREFARGRTVFIITHSVGPSILEFADRIAVMDQGHLVGLGPHDALVETCPVYTNLYRAQVRQRSTTGSGGEPPQRSAKPTDSAAQTAAPSPSGSDPDILQMPQGRPAKRRQTPPTGSDG
jgi:subfamily B ATP-binding cassette protein MsbA